MMLDLRGYRCPVVATKAKRTMKALQPGEILDVLSDDPASEKDMTALCASAGWSMTMDIDHDRVEYRYKVIKS